MRVAAIKAIACHLPVSYLSNQALSDAFPEWTAEKISEKTGIDGRYIAAENETACDLAIAAAEKLFSSYDIDRSEIDFLLFCSSLSDYILPTTACVIQNRLGLKRGIGALDYNLGCSGFVYGLALAKGLIECGMAERVLILTADTYSKFIHPLDKSVRTLFGDGAAATLITAETAPEEMIGPFVFGTDGSGAEDLIIPAGGARLPRSSETSKLSTDISGNVRSLEHLYMNGPEVMAFTLGRVPKAVHALLERSNKNLDDYDLFVFHQASRLILDKLRKKIDLPSEKFVIGMGSYGNVVSSSIPFALKPYLSAGEQRKTVLLAGFGVGLSWAVTNIVIN